MLEIVVGIHYIICDICCYKKWHLVTRSLVWYNYTIFFFFMYLILVSCGVGYMTYFLMSIFKNTWVQNHLCILTFCLAFLLLGPDWAVFEKRCYLSSQNMSTVGNRKQLPTSRGMRKSFARKMSRSRAVPELVISTDLEC